MTLMCKLNERSFEPFVYFSGFEIKTMTASCPKDLSVRHLNIYHFANKVTHVNVFLSQSSFLHMFVVLNLGLPLTSVTRCLG